MALGSLALPSGDVGFNAQGTAMMPVSAGKEVVGTIELKSPFEMFKETFTSMKTSLLNMVNLQSKEQKDAAFVGPMKPNDDLEGVETDTPLGDFVDKAENVSGNILDTIKEAFDNVSFGPKMTAILFAGGLVFFMKYKDRLVKVLTPIVQFVKDMIDTFGPGKVFAAFIGGFLLLKSGLAKKAILFAGQNILKGIKASAAAIDKQGGLLKAMGNGFEKINKGMGSLVNGAKKTGTFITTNLTKGFNKLGTGIEAMNKGVAKAGGAIKGGFTKVLGLIGKGFVMMKVGMTSMLSSLGPVLAPLLPVIAIAVGIAAIMFSLKSGFDTFKESLENGDSMFTAVIKGLGDAMLTLVTLPATLVKKLVGFIAGLFGFDNFKEKLESFSIKDAIVGAFRGLTDGMFRIVKAIAKGVVAALAAALPGGKTPQAEFARAYQEVMKGGEGKSKIETQEMETTEPNADGEYYVKKRTGGDAKRVDMTSMYDNRAGNEVGDASTAESFYANERKDQKYMDSLPESMSDSSKKMYLEIKKQDMKNLDKKMEQTEVIKNADGSTSKTASTSGTYIVKGGNIQGDTINQMSQTTIGGDLEVNNQERTQRAIQELAAF
jgi:hypothetical protein